MEDIDGPRVLRGLVTQPEVQPIIPKPIAPTITQKEAQFFALAKELGYSVTPMAKWQKELATRIAASMRTRESKRPVAVSRVCEEVENDIGVVKEEQ